MWTSIVKKQMIYILAQITLPRYSQTPHQFFASGQKTLFTRDRNSISHHRGLRFCIALYECKKSAVCRGVKNQNSIINILSVVFWVWFSWHYGISTTWCSHHPETLKLRTTMKKGYAYGWWLKMKEVVVVSVVQLSTSTSLWFFCARSTYRKTLRKANQHLVICIWTFRYVACFIYYLSVDPYRITKSTWIWK